MKKLIILSALATALLLTSERPASAWCNIKFGAGVNLHWQSGDNNCLWGVYRNGQIPHPAGYPGGHGGHGYPGGYGGMPTYYDPLAAGSTAPLPGANDSKQVNTPGMLPGNLNQTGYSANPYNPYHPVSYQHGYPYQSSNYPNYYPYQVPSYWYGQ
jgi:hypothetical protein